ncbi:MAG: hypothetical protein NC311_18335 [Muribaculaceae bacterium]|nr:hypothetical protein [Muribaculaceae bacterium]MCM1515370.1 hypothetical protein [Paraprevotella sp.]
MKKEYIKPAVTCINVDCEAIIALSAVGGTEIGGSNKDDFEMLGRDDKVTNPNLWEQGW